YRAGRGAGAPAVGEVESHGHPATVWDSIGNLRITGAVGKADGHRHFISRHVGGSCQGARVRTCREGTLTARSLGVRGAIAAMNSEQRVHPIDHAKGGATVSRRHGATTLSTAEGDVKRSPRGHYTPVVLPARRGVCSRASM